MDWDKAERLKEMKKRGALECQQVIQAADTSLEKEKTVKKKKKPVGKKKK